MSHPLRLVGLPLYLQLSYFWDFAYVFWSYWMSSYCSLFVSFPSHPSGCTEVPMLIQSLPWPGQAPLVSPTPLRNPVLSSPVEQTLPQDNSFFSSNNWTKFLVHSTLLSLVHGITLILYCILLFVLLKTSSLSSCPSPSIHQYYTLHLTRLVTLLPRLFVFKVSPMLIYGYVNLVYFL